MIQHREGQADGFTKKHGIKTLVYFEHLETMEQAIAREKQLKKYHRDWKINLIERENRHWEDLGPSIGLEPLTVLQA